MYKYNVGEFWGAFKKKNYMFTDVNALIIFI